MKYLSNIGISPPFFSTESETDNWRIILEDGMMLHHHWRWYYEGGTKFILGDVWHTGTWIMLMHDNTNNVLQMSFSNKSKFQVHKANITKRVDLRFIVCR